MKQKLLSLMTLLCFAVSGAWADQTYHSVKANVANTPYEIYHIYDAGSSCVIKTKKTTLNDAFTSWVSGGIYDYGSSTYSVPVGIANNWLAASGKGAKIRNDASETALVFYVTNCVGVTVLGKAAGSADNKKLTLSVKKDDAEVGTLAESTTTSVHEFSYGTALNKDYSYKITVACSGANNSEVYQIKFEAPAIVTTIGTTGWSTFSHSSALDFDNATKDDPASNDLKAYIVTGFSGSSLTKSDALASAPAETGLLIKGTAGAKYYIPVTKTPDALPGSNCLQASVSGGTVSAGEDPNVNYVLMNDGGSPVFQWIGATSATLGANKAYLTLNGGPKETSARGLWFDDETTGLNKVEMQNAETNGVFYNLAGQRISQPTKGLYIVNGKKVIIK